MKSTLKLLIKKIEMAITKEKIDEWYPEKINTREGCYELFKKICDEEDGELMFEAPEHENFYLDEISSILREMCDKDDWPESLYMESKQENVFCLYTENASYYLNRLSDEQVIKLTMNIMGYLNTPYETEE